MLEKNKLSGTNFLDWARKLRIVHKQGKKVYILENPIPNHLANNAPRVEKDGYSKHKDDSNDVTRLMLATMESELQKQFEEVEAYEMIKQLKKMFQEQVRQERYLSTKALNSCKMTPGTSVSAHVLKMKGYFDQLEKLGAPVSHDLATYMILVSLTSDYVQFVIMFLL
ncbi:hypothetical protein M9H77_19079 [Catharanthus roseus]|uniref:Uncharacterized protein n=1 Tax=Catharanthus roseus TaxID=4058 RepID=A0ACC0B9A2_CATRO|nr:hypothetical protein M9H77_19079 [Catharanthus roseus]